MRDKAVLVETTILVDYLRGSDAAADCGDKRGREAPDLFSLRVKQTFAAYMPRDTTGF